MRNLTNTPGVMERDPAWSPDGKSVAYFSDESGEYALHIKPQNGAGETEEDRAAGQERVLFRPEVVARFEVDRVHRQHDQPVERGVASGKVTKVDSDYLYDLNRGFNWSGDSKWIAFERFGAEPPALDLGVDCRDRQEHADYRRHERRAQSGLRPRRAVSLFHRQHQLRPDLERPGYDQRRARGHQQRVSGGAAQQHGRRRWRRRATKKGRPSRRRRPAEAAEAGAAAGAGGGRCAGDAAETGAHRFRQHSSSASSPCPCRPATT